MMTATTTTIQPPPLALSTPDLELIWIELCRALQYAPSGPRHTHRRRHLAALMLRIDTQLGRTPDRRTPQGVVPR